MKLWYLKLRHNYSVRKTGEPYRPLVEYLYFNDSWIWPPENAFNYSELHRILNYYCCAKMSIQEIQNDKHLKVKRTRERIRQILLKFVREALRP